MDHYPDQLAPRGNYFTKEPFATWWVRVRQHLPHVPLNVARQWVWRHWGLSEFGWIPSARTRFQLERWGTSAVATIQVDGERPGEYES